MIINNILKMFRIVINDINICKICIIIVLITLNLTVKIYRLRSLSLKMMMLTCKMLILTNRNVSRFILVTNKDSTKIFFSLKIMFHSWKMKMVHVILAEYNLTINFLTYIIFLYVKYIFLPEIKEKSVKENE